MSLKTAGIVETCNRITTGQAARHLGVEVTTVRRWINEGYRGAYLPAVKIGFRSFIDPEDLAEFLEEIEDL